jgi:hypothetical protein
MILMDNNVVASPRFKEIIAEIRDLGFVPGAKLKRANERVASQRRVDFNQGVDARILSRDKMYLRELSSICLSPAECTEVSYGKASNPDDHFFEVRMRNVARHRQDMLLNEKMIAHYLAQVAPVPFSDDFSHARSIEEMLGKFLPHVPIDYFTGYKGNVSEVYYPTVDTLATANMEFLVGDTAKTFVDEEKLQSWTVTQPDPKSMRWQATTDNIGHNWQITKMIFTDPSNSTLIQQTTFQALNGKTVGDFNLYLLYKPYLKNAAADNSGSTVVSGGHTYLVASSSDSSDYTAFRASIGWTVENGVTMVSSGYYG